LSVPSQQQQTRSSTSSNAPPAAAAAPTLRRRLRRSSDGSTRWVWVSVTTTSGNHNEEEDEEEEEVVIEDPWAPLRDDSALLITNEIQWREAFLYNVGARVLPEGDDATDEFDRAWGDGMNMMNR
jgi:hypothetical protein